MRRRTFLEGASLSAIASALLVEVACSGSSVVTALEVALEAIQIGLPELAALTGIPENIATAAYDYAVAINDALQQSTTILDGPDTDAEKATLIFALFTAIVRPAIPAQYQALGQLITTIASDVAAFLSSVPGQAKSLALKGNTTKFSTSDHLRLLHAHALAADNMRKLANLRKR